MTAGANQIVQNVQVVQAVQIVQAVRRDAEAMEKLVSSFWFFVSS
jgi:hypothetical protein